MPNVKYVLYNLNKFGTIWSMLDDLILLNAGEIYIKKM